LHERYRGLPIIVVEDALYANAPHLRQITGYGWRYVINVNRTPTRVWRSSLPDDGRTAE
jgi:hypothetical protein